VQAVSDTETLRPAQARGAVAAIFLVNGTAFASWVPHIPTVQQKLDLSPGVLGLALLAIAAGSLVSMPLAGWMVARHGSRIVALVAGSLYCAVVPLPLLAPSLSALVVTLILFGAFNGAMDVSMNAHGVAVERQLGRPIMSSLHAMFSIGGIVGAGSAVVLLPLGVAPITHVGVTALLGFALMLMTARFLLPHAVDSGVDGPHFVVPRGSLLVLGAMGFFILMTEGAMGDWTAVYLRMDLGAGAGLAGAGFAVFSAAMAVGRLTGDRLVAAFGPVAMVGWGAMVAALGLGGALLLHDPLAAILGFGLVGLGLANIVPILFSAAGRTPGMAPGAAIAAVTTAGYSGFLAGPPLVGFAAEWIGLPAALGLLAVAVGSMAVWARMLKR
jgi:Major Facilitator Superfamily